MEKTKCSERNLFQCYIVHHTSHIYGPAIETVLLGERLATNRPFRKPFVPFIHVSIWYGVLSVACHKLNVWTTVIFTVTRNLTFTSCQFLSAFAKFQKVTIRFDMSVLSSVCLFASLPTYLPTCLSARLFVHLFVPPHWTTRLPLERYSWNCIFEYFSKVCLERFKFY